MDMAVTKTKTKTERATTPLASKNSPQKEAALWFDRKVRQAQSGLVTEVVDLTPDLAAVLLERNPNNRHLKPTTVLLYVRDIRRGTWAFNGEPIIVSKDGQLNDGQHRCQAVIEAGKPIKVLLVFGVERETMNTLDQGSVRKLGDYLYMGGHVDTNNLASAAQYLWAYQNHRNLKVPGRERATKTELMSMIEKYPGLAHSLKAVGPAHTMRVAQTSVLAVAHFVIGQLVPAQAVDEFFRKLAYGEDLNSYSPVLYLRNRLLSDGSKMRPNEKMELIIRNWNLHAQGADRKVMKLSGGRLPEIKRMKGYD